MIIRARTGLRVEAVCHEAGTLPYRTQRMTVTTTAERLVAVRSRIDAAARRSGRQPGDVTLVAVTKNVDPPRIMEAVNAGIRHCGENYVQEALAKQRALPIGQYAIEWHFIGHLQRNKAKDVVDRFALIQSVDSLLLARKIGERAIQLGREANVLLQVKLDPNQAKFGIGSDDTLRAAEAAREIPGIKVIGLMGMAPFAEHPEASRNGFRALRALYELLPPDTRQVLSMGMTADFEVAIEEGATLVRIGTAIFGPRAAP